MSQDHPSFLMLDRARLGIRDAVTSEHLTNCRRCAEYVSTISVDLPVPNWVSEIKTDGSLSGWASFLRWRRYARPAFAAFALVGLSVLIVPQILNQDAYEDVGGRGTRPKGGSPAVGVYVNRAGKVMQWDGRVSLLPGDLVQLQVAPAGFDRIRVYSVSDSGGQTKLYDGKLPAEQMSSLPVSWEIDGANPRERLEVELSKDDARLNSWKTVLTLPVTKGN